MNFIRQFAIILVISFLGELLNYLLPLPIPASIYGLALMLLALCLGLLHVEDVKETSVFLIEIMPLMFIPAAAGLITSMDIIRGNWLAYLVVTAVSTVLVMLVSGQVTQLLIHRKAKKEARK